MTPVEKYGVLKVAADNTAGGKTRMQLCDKSGKPVVLKGMSTLGLQWSDGDWMLTDEAFDALAYDWRCDVIRLAMYVCEGGYSEKPEELLVKVEKGIELATKRGLYVIVDWHILTPGDPCSKEYLTAGLNLPQYKKIREAEPEYEGPQLFFAYLAQKYASYGNILWELCNEPNGLGSEAESGRVWKEKLRPYCQRVTDAIRKYGSSEHGIVICGTDNWSQFVDAPAVEPITDKMGQVMYAFHFYAGTHDAGFGTDENRTLRNRIVKALNSGLAVFCTEWGTSLASGDGGPFLELSERWLGFMEEHKISWCMWSMGKRNEISSAARENATERPMDINGDGIPEWDESELTESGRFAREKIRSGK